MNKLYPAAWRRTKNGSAYLGRAKSAAATAYEKEVWVAFIQSGGKRLDGEVSVTVFLHPPADKRRRDIDAGIKTLLDSLMKAGAFADDSQVARLLLERCEPKGEGHLHVLISERLFDPARAAVQEIANAMREPS